MCGTERRLERRDAEFQGKSKRDKYVFYSPVCLHFIVCI